MSYDLVVWVGSRPASPKAADKQYERMIRRLERDDDTPPHPRLVAYAEALLERWPEGEGSPWAVEPLLSDAVGDVFPLSVLTVHAKVVAAYAAGMARKLGLVCYDPQEGLLRP
ncbi:hypothetical protein EV649_1647 [Kribbella sp. VKM Ac-2569]|uniref:hypothetical protein n=1 Tax=Kribbella sp. VKM Ac-2569 TaxID=2512220 RepID=UPI00102C1811|nr:hypothetical protein [Kribbella sp. VKM Ac-2569]RZT27873.1 hypothetical protein EV649_1647 [Kribbella sp. VKM Ac-2569]